MTGQRQGAAWRAGLILLFWCAWGLLLFRLNEVPPGFQHDQTFSTLNALQVLGGHYPIYFPENFGRGPLFMYSVAGLFRVTGGHLVWSLRFTAVIWAMLGLAATVALARRYLTETMALLSGTLMAGSFWFLLAGRLGVESIALLPLATCMVYFLDRGMARHSWRDLALAGILGGVADYTYLASRSLYLLMALVILYAAGATLRQWRQTGRSLRSHLAGGDLPGLLLAFALMFAVSGPLLLYLSQQQGAGDGRIQELSGAINAALEGNFVPVLQNLWDTVAAILWRGSYALPYHYGVPGRPALQPVWAILLLVGLVATCRRARRRHEFLLLAALGVGLLANFLTGADALYMRSIYALPLLFILTARGVSTVCHLGRMKALRRVPATGLAIIQWTLLLGLVFWHVADSSRAYFVTWATAEPAQRIYNADWRAAAAYLDGVDSNEEVYIGTDRLLDLDSLTYQYYEPWRTDVQWYQLPDSPPLPAQGSALYLLPASSELPPALAALAEIAREPFTIAAPSGAHDLLRGFYLAAEDIARFEQQHGSQSLPRPVIVGGALRLDAVGVQDRGDYAEVLTSWTVLAAWPRSARPGYPPTRPKLAVALTDNIGYKWAQVDAATSIPFQTWQPGQKLLEITRLHLPADIPPGKYSVNLSMYDDEQGPLAACYGGTPVAAPIVAGLQLAPRQLAQAPEPPFPLLEDGGEGPLRAVGQWERLDRLFTGVPAYVHLSWQAGEAMSTRELRFYVRARTEDGGMLWQQTDELLEPLPPVWPAAQVFRLTHRLAPQTPGPGITPAQVEICALQGETILACAGIGQAQVTSYPPQMVLPRQPAHAGGATWSEGPALAGYDLELDDRSLSLTLYWQAGSPPSTRLKRFVHAVDAGDTIVAQSDDELQNRGIPIIYWRPGEYVTDTVTLELAPGQNVANLYVGLYRPDTGERIPARLPSGAPIPDDRVLIPVLP